MNSFWNTITKPILCLAPMADVTDPAYRKIIAKYGRPDVMWTEFVSADGIYHTREIERISDKENPLMKDLQYSKKEKPIVAQVFTSNPKHMEYISALVLELGFDGIDINMGCPHRAIEKQGAGASLIKQPQRAVELIEAARDGMKDKIPLSVKTRIGYNKNEIEEWLPVLLKAKPEVLTLHARTRKEMSKVKARWEHVKRAVELRNKYSKDTLIIGNGDVKSVEEANEKATQTGADGVMIGRGIFGNPWLFSKHTPTTKEKITVLVEHCNEFDALCNHKSFAVMKKHFKAYVTGFTGSKELRIKLYNTNSTAEVKAVVHEFLQNN